MKIKILSVAVICLTAFGLWLFQPYMQREYVRLSETPVTIEAEYFTVTCEPLCTQLYRVENGKITNNGVFPNMPADIPDPHSISELKDGDRLLLTGYLYVWQETNLITGSISTREINMIDVIRWQTPDRVSYKSQQSNHAPAAFRHENYTDCRP
ncbi:hypothetical protein SG34_014150 [Thalassomonas viridans]|uniref:Uncharacterized protein n=1 Tax=Thalassomonas viridans TaxID=137584 RepID=A0AAE9Z7G0_9GAMM|nr:hypothetical protein [Thalassomonas viridans]WDE07923.1 hypothetical protein SG34_014150 [Thalassomonas viridans]